MGTFLADFPKHGHQQSSPVRVHRRARKDHGPARDDILSTGLKARRFGSAKGIAGRLACMTAEQKPP